MDDKGFISKSKKRKLTAEDRTPVGEYSRLQKPYNLIQQHMTPYKRAHQRAMEIISNEVMNIINPKSTKRICRGSSTSMDRHPYTISLFDVNMDSGSASKKKVRKEDEYQKTGYSEVLNWEKELVRDHVDELKAMFEFKQIYFFIHKKKKKLNFLYIPLYIVERMFLMPRESTHLASLMTALLNHYFHLKGYSPEAPMPYELWNSYLKMKVDEWYDVVESFAGDTIAATNYIGFEHDFFIILGPTNPLQFCDFHDLNLLQKVWLVKSFCDSLTLDDENSDEDSEEEDDVDKFDCPWLGTDRQGRYYFYLSYVKGQENVRVYRLYKYFFPVAGSFYDRVQRENRGQVAPCKKYHELIADDVPSLHRLANEFAEKLEREEMTSEMSPGPDCETKLHQQLIALLLKMEPLESKLKASTLKMLMLIKSDWDRYHRSGMSTVSQYSRNEEHNRGSESVETKSSLQIKSEEVEVEYLGDGRAASPAHHFLVSVKDKSCLPQLKRIVPYLNNVRKCQKLNLPNVRVIPLKRLNKDRDLGVEILTTSEKDGNDNSKQLVVCGSKGHCGNEETAVDSDSDDSVLIVDDDVEVLSSAAAPSSKGTPRGDMPVRNTIFSKNKIRVPHLSEKRINTTTLPRRSHSLAKTANQTLDWDTANSGMSDDSLDHSEIVESSISDTDRVRKRSKSNVESIHTNADKSAQHDSKQASCSDVQESGEDLYIDISEDTDVDKHQPFVIRVDGGKGAKISSKNSSLYEENEDETVRQGLKKGDLRVSFMGNFTKDISPQPKTSALSTKCNTENCEKSPDHESPHKSPGRIHTARKSFSSSRRQTASFSAGTQPNSSAELRARTLTHDITSQTDDPLFCPKATITVRKLNVGNVAFKSQGTQVPLRMLKATGICKASEKADSSSNVMELMKMKFPVVSSAMSPPVKKFDGSSYQIISPKRTATHSESTSLKDTSPKKSPKSVVNKPALPTRKSTRGSEHSQTASSHGNQNQMDENEYADEADESCNSSNQKISMKSFPASQQLIYTLSPMQTSFTTRNSLETRISATKDRLNISDDGKELPSQTSEHLSRSDVVSSDAVANTSKKRKIQNESNKIPLEKINSCKIEVKVKTPSALVSSVVTSPTVCTSSGSLRPNDVNLTPKSEKTVKSNKPECVKQSSTVMSLSGQTAITSSRSASGTHPHAEISPEVCNGVSVRKTELIPVVLPDGKNILLRLVSSRPPSSRISSSTDSSQTPQLRNTSLETAGAKSSQKSSDDNSPHVSSVSGQSTSVKKDGGAAQITLPPSPASSCSREDPSFVDDTYRRDGETDVKDKKSAAANTSPSSAMVKKCTGSTDGAASLSIPEIRVRKTYSRKAKELKQSPAKELKQSPAKELKQSPAKELKQSPAKELKQSLAKELKQSPAKELKQPPAKDLKQSSAKELKQSPAKELKQSPAKELMQSSAKELMQSPSKELMQSPNSSSDVTGDKTKSTKEKKSPLQSDMPKVKKVEIPLIASKILHNLASGETPSSSSVVTSSSPAATSTPSAVASTSSAVTSISSAVTPNSSSNTSCTPQMVTVNSTPPVHGTGSALSILNANGASGGIIILSQSQSGNNAVFTQPTALVNQNPLLLMPPGPSTSSAQPVTTPTGLTAPLPNVMQPSRSSASVSLQPESSSSVSSAQPVMFLCQDQLYMMPSVPSVVARSPFPPIAPKPDPSAAESLSQSHDTSIDEIDGGWEVVPDPFELKKGRFLSLEEMLLSKPNITPQKRENTVSYSIAPHPEEFPGNREPPVLASSKKTSEKYDLNLNPRRSALTLDEPVTVMPSKIQEMTQEVGLKYNPNADAWTIDANTVTYEKLPTIHQEMPQLTPMEIKIECKEYNQSDTCSSVASIRQCKENQSQTYCPPASTMQSKENKQSHAQSSTASTGECKENKKRGRPKGRRGRPRKKR